MASAPKSSPSPKASLASLVHLKPHGNDFFRVLCAVSKLLNLVCKRCLRPATELPELVDASTLKGEVAEGVALIVVRELTGGIYFGKPRGFSSNQNGEDIGFNIEVYAKSEVFFFSRVVTTVDIVISFFTRLRSLFLNS